MLFPAILFIPLVCSEAAPEEGTSGRVGRSILPYGAPYGLAPVGGAGIHPLYGRPMVFGAGFGSNMHGMGNHFGNNGLYANYLNDGYGRNFANGMSQVGGQGMRGYSGGHAMVNGNQGNQGYQSNALGNQFDRNGGGYSSNANNRNLASRNGFGGAGGAGHRKGHKTTGFHKSYHNVESGKDTNFIDEDHDVGQQSYDSMYGNNFADDSFNGYNGGGRAGTYGQSDAYNMGGQGGVSSQGLQDARWNSRDHNGLYNNQDHAYLNSHLNTNRNQRLGFGANGGGFNNMGNNYYNGYPGYF